MTIDDKIVCLNSKKRHFIAFKIGNEVISVNDKYIHCTDIKYPSSTSLIETVKNKIKNNAKRLNIYKIENKRLKQKNSKLILYNKNTEKIIEKMRSIIIMQSSMLHDKNKCNDQYNLHAVCSKLEKLTMKNL